MDLHFNLSSIVLTQCIVLVESLLETISLLSFLSYSIPLTILTRTSTYQQQHGPKGPSPIQSIKSITMP